MRCWYMAKRTTSPGAWPLEGSPCPVQASMAPRRVSVVRASASATADGSLGMGSSGAGRNAVGWTIGEEVGEGGREEGLEDDAGEGRIPAGPEQAATSSDAAAKTAGTLFAISPLIVTHGLAS